MQRRRFIGHAWLDVHSLTHFTPLRPATALRPVDHGLNLDQSPEPIQRELSIPFGTMTGRDVGVCAGLYLWRLVQLCSQKAKTHNSNCLMA